MISKIVREAGYGGQDGRVKHTYIAVMTIEKT